MESKSRDEAADASLPQNAVRDEDGDDAALEQLLRPKPPAKSRTRGGTGIGRDLDH